MTGEPQKSLAGYKSTIKDGADFENPNEGKPLLDDSEEYILQLIKFPHVIAQSKTKEKADGTKTTVKVDTAVCEFEEKATKNIVVAFFRVDSLNFSDDEKFESGVIRFFKKIKHPLVENVEPKWEDYFIVGMRFRARVVVKKDQDKKPTGTYYLDVPTCRPLLPSDKAGEDFATEPQQQGTGGTLADLLVYAKGCKSAGDVFAIAYGKVPASVIQEFVAADKRGEIKYPIA